MRFPWKIVRTNELKMLRNSFEAQNELLGIVTNIRPANENELLASIKIRDKEISELKKQLAAAIDRNSETFKRYEAWILANKKTIAFVKALKEISAESINADLS